MSGIQGQLNGLCDGQKISNLIHQNRAEVMAAEDHLYKLLGLSEESRCRSGFYFTSSGSDVGGGVDFVPDSILFGFLGCKLTGVK